MIGIKIICGKDSNSQSTHLRLLIPRESNKDGEKTVWWSQEKSFSRMRKKIIPPHIFHRIKFLETSSYLVSSLFLKSQSHFKPISFTSLKNHFDPEFKWELFKEFSSAKKLAQNFSWELKYLFLVPFFSILPSLILFFAWFNSRITEQFQLSSNWMGIVVDHVRK